MTTTVDLTGSVGTLTPDIERRLAHRDAGRTPQPLRPDSAPEGSGTDSEIAALTVAMHPLPLVLRRSVTWDRGIEMRRHHVFTAREDAGVFCEARSPGSGSNENTNCLLRQYLPKGTDLRAFRLRPERRRRRN